MKRTDNPGGRPRKYASDAERARAYRERWTLVSARVEARTKETLQTIADATGADITFGDVINAAVKFYALNYPWQSGNLFGKRLPTIQDKATREQMERERKNREFLESENGDSKD